MTAATYTLKRTTVYPGGHAADPGYRSATVTNAKGDRELHFHCDLNGFNPRDVGTRPANTTAAFRKCPQAFALKVAAELEDTVAKWLTES